MARFDSKEYTRLRDIVQKRSKRLVSAGLAEQVHFPTIREIKAGLVSAFEAMEAVKGYYSGGSTLKAVRETGLVPELKAFPVLPEKPKLSNEEKKIRKRRADRLYRQRKKIRQSITNPEKARKYEGYLKALQTVSKTWKKAGFDIGIDLSTMTPQQAQAFVEYMDYRFSQGDFNQKYVIDEFIQDFSKLLKKGYKGSEITSDFEKFLEQRNGLQSRSEAMEGLNSYELKSYWDQFINPEDEDDTDDWLPF